MVVAIVGTIYRAASENRRASKVLLLGFICGMASGAILRQRRGGIGRFAARALTLVSVHVRPAVWPAGAAGVGWEADGYSTSRRLAVLLEGQVQDGHLAGRSAVLGEAAEA